MVLGSDCFAKRYGLGGATGFRGYGAGGGGRQLTEAERDRLLHNTAALLELFEAERTNRCKYVNVQLTGRGAVRLATRRFRPVLGLGVLFKTSRVEARAAGRRGYSASDLSIRSVGKYW